MSKMQAPLVSIVNAVVLLKQAEYLAQPSFVAQREQTSKIRSARDECMLAYTALQKPWDVDFEEAVALAMEELGLKDTIAKCVKKAERESGGSR